MSRKLALAATALAALAALAVSGCSDDTATMPAAVPSASVPSASADVRPPAGYRFVGIGHAAVAVPGVWATNKAHCGTPTADTVMIDVYAVDSCLAPRPAGVESVELLTGERGSDFVVDRTLTVDGVEVQRQATTCQDDEFSKVSICSGRAYLPSEQVHFQAASSTDREAVDAILDAIRILPGQRGVPGFSAFQNEDQERSQQSYLADLEAAGFRTEVRTELHRGMPAGFVLAADPAPGTMAHPGDLVTVTASGAGEGPADELTVEMNSHDAKGQYDTPTLTDQQIRDGATVTLHVGDAIWAFASGKYEATLAATFDGAALTASTWAQDPNKGHSWVAAKPGTSTVTLTITVGGKKVELGTVTVVVQPAR
ncbi:PASTA domain-containing protein [Sporichthya sp.]|uniref:PASTA domain-containing protein n=1 Tax=Sporichthya sp. TaxID=65475 RepID=UPI0017C5B2AF|nr:PASTA domain-containing protein [Sporichthya sp.]MBA3742515.1 hypothetical protein [Sporichthya sp.]